MKYIFKGFVLFFGFFIPAVLMILPLFLPAIWEKVLPYGHPLQTPLIIITVLLVLMFYLGMLGYSSEQEEKNEKSNSDSSNTRVD